MCYLSKGHVYVSLTGCKIIILKGEAVAVRSSCFTEAEAPRSSED